MKNRFRLAAVVTLLLASGCVTHHHRHPHGMPPGQAKKLGCVHAPGCGHVLSHGVWISASVESSPAGPPGHAKHKGPKP